MTFNFEEISREWLGGGRVAMLPDELEAAFDRCERILGRTWMDVAKRNVVGSLPTLTVAAVGQQLASIEDIAGRQPLIDKLRRNDQSAFAELRAIHLMRSQESCRVELEPTVSVGQDRIRKCDFRIRRNDDPWLYVEVTQPDVSEAQARLQQLLDPIMDVVNSLKRSFALEVFLRREPADDEVAPLVARIFEFCSVSHLGDELAQQELADGLGILFLNERPPGQIVLDDHGEPPAPRLGAARATFGSDEPHRHVVVRVPYADGRAEQFLTSEARQLPTDMPGLIMVDMAHTRGGFQSWEPLLRRRFQPSMHTRVGGVCLFASGIYPTDRGEASRSETKLIENPFARIPLPPWVGTTCAAINGVLSDQASGK